MKHLSLTRVLQLATAFAAAAAVCIYLTYGMSRSLWLDEANSVLIAQQSPRQIIHSLFNDVSPPAYYLVLSAWMKLFGSSEIALRMLSSLFFLAGIVCLWIVGRMLLGTQGASVVAFIYAVNPIVGRQAQNVRMYTMLAMWVGLSMIAIVAMMRKKERRTLPWYAFFGITAFLGLNTHYWFAFVLIVYAFWVLFNWRLWTIKELALLAVFAVLPFLALDLPMFLHQTQLPSALWTPRPGLGALRDVVTVNFGLLPFHPLHSRRALLVVMAVGLPALAAIGLRRYGWTPAIRAGLLYAGFGYALVLIVPFLISMRRPIFWPGRYDIVAIPFFAVLGGALLLGLPIRYRLFVQLVLALSCSWYFVQMVRQSNATQELLTLDRAPLGDRAAASAICTESAAGDFVVYTGLSRAAISYYLERLGCSRRVTQVSYPAEFAGHMGWQDPRINYSQEPAIGREAESVVQAAARSGARVFLLYQPDPRLSSGMLHALDREYRAISSHKFNSCLWCFDELRVYQPIRAIPR